MKEPVKIRTVVLRVSGLSLLLLLILVATITVRTLNRVPNTFLYFVESGETSFTLRRQLRQLPRGKPDERVRRTLEALIEGPSESERAQGLSSALPEDTRVLGVRLRGEELEVNVSDAFTTGGGSAAMQARLNQVFYTLTQPNSVEAVRLLVEGVPLTYLGGEGIIVENPWYRAQHEGLPVW